MTPHYTRKAQDRQNRGYGQLASIEASIAGVQTRMDIIRQHRISTDNVYQFLLYFDKRYDQFTTPEKKTFMNSFIGRVAIYPERHAHRKAHQVPFFLVFQGLGDHWT